MFKKFFTNIGFKKVVTVTLSIISVLAIVIGIFTLTGCKDGKVPQNMDDVTDAVGGLIEDAEDAANDIDSAVNDAKDKVNDAKDKVDSAKDKVNSWKDNLTSKKTKTTNTTVATKNKTDATTKKSTVTTKKTNSTTSKNNAVATKKTTKSTKKTTVSTKKTNKTTTKKTIATTAPKYKTIQLNVKTTYFGYTGYFTKDSSPTHINNSILGLSDGHTSVGALVTEYYDVSDGNYIYFACDTTVVRPPIFKSYIDNGNGRFTIPVKTK